MSEIGNRIGLRIIPKGGKKHTVTHLRGEGWQGGARCEEGDPFPLSDGTSSKGIGGVVQADDGNHLVFVDQP